MLVGLWLKPLNSGARGRDRTTDTAIFSRMLYQLSYPGVQRRNAEQAGVIVGRRGAVQPWGKVILKPSEFG